MALFQLIYQSQAMVPFEAPELLALRQQARAFNHAHGITGILLHTPDGRFLQLLEGEELAVRHLYYHRIEPDPRHRDCRVLAQGPCPARSCTDWTLELRAAQPVDVRALLAHVPATNQALLVPRARTLPELVAALCDFVAHGLAHDPV